MSNMKFLMMRKLRLLFLALAFFALAVSCNKNEPDIRPGWVERPSGFSNRYALDEMVVLSRHNIRSPLSGGGSVLSRITPHSWFEWTSKPSELSVKGGELEVIMGGFFREWVDQENLFDGKQPAANETRFYSNSLQRTIATTSNFINGMYPSSGFKVEHHMTLGTMDPVFNPQTTGVDDAFQTLALNEIAAMGGADGFVGLGRKMASNFTLLEQVLDIKDSPAAKNDTLTIATDDVKITIKDFAEPSMKGGLKMACSASDALTLQYYEETDDAKASFGHNLSFSDWEKITAIKEWYQEVLFTSPAVAKNVSALMINEIRSELLLPNRKFTFLCGHDSNLGSVMAALHCKKFDLTDALEKSTPIGGKLVFEKWHGKDGKEYIDMLLVYASASQLRAKSNLSLSTPPSYVKLEISGLPANADGLYRMDDFLAYLESL